MKTLDVNWSVNGKTIVEKRVTDVSAERLAALIWTMSCREYRIARVFVDGKEF